MPHRRHCEGVAAMNRRSDAFDELCRHDPIDEFALPSHDSPQAQRLLAEITAAPRNSRHTSSRRRRIATAIAVGIAAVATFGAAWIVTRPVTQPQNIVCYQSIDLNSDRVGVGYGNDVTAAACARAWADGTLTNPEFGPTGSTPPLVACVSDVGSLAVFPSNDPNVCQDLGLADVDPSSVPGAGAVRSLNDNLVDYFLSDSCIPLPRATDDIRSILDAGGFADWTIVETQGAPDRTCGSFSMDAESTTIYIIGIPRLSP